MAEPTKLTVQQKNYMAKRIDSIVEAKLKTIEDEYKGKIKFRTGNQSGLDWEVVEAIINGDVQINSTEKIVGILRKRLEIAKENEAQAELQRAAGRYYGGYKQNIVLGTSDVVDKKVVTKYHTKHNADAKRFQAEKLKRIEAVKAEAVKVKDKVILDGSEAAVALLEEFANKKF